MTEERRKAFDADLDRNIDAPDARSSRAAIAAAVGGEVRSRRPE